MTRQQGHSLTTPQGRQRAVRGCHQATRRVQATQKGWAAGRQQPEHEESAAGGFPSSIMAEATAVDDMEEEAVSTLSLELSEAVSSHVPHAVPAVDDGASIMGKRPLGVCVTAQALKERQARLTLVRQEGHVATSGIKGRAAHEEVFNGLWLSSVAEGARRLIVHKHRRALVAEGGLAPLHKQRACAQPCHELAQEWVRAVEI